MTAVAIGPLAAGDPARYAALAALLALLVGLLAVVAWLVRLGFVADLLSRPVLVGYLAGVALIMMAGQLGRLTGVRVTGESFIGQVISFTGRLVQVNPRRCSSPTPRTSAAAPSPPPATAPGRPAGSS